MSLSATSDSASSKRLLTPEDESPQPAKRQRPTLEVSNGSYTHSDPDSLGHAKVHLPPILSNYGSSEHGRHDYSTRRSSLPTDSLNARGTYPNASYSFPPLSDQGLDASSRPRVDTQVSLGVYHEHSGYPGSATTPPTATSYYGASPLSPAE
jgi:hypothetical protein